MISICTCVCKVVWYGYTANIKYQFSIPSVRRWSLDVRIRRIHRIHRWCLKIKGFFKSSREVAWTTIHSSVHHTLQTWRPTAINIPFHRIRFSVISSFVCLSPSTPGAAAIDYRTALQIQQAVTAYLKSKKLPPFGFARWGRPDPSQRGDNFLLPFPVIRHCQESDSCLQMTGFLRQGGGGGLLNNYITASGLKGRTYAALTL